MAYNVLLLSIFPRKPEKLSFLGKMALANQLARLHEFSYLRNRYVFLFETWGEYNGVGVAHGLLCSWI